MFKMFQRIIVVVLACVLMLATGTVVHAIPAVTCGSGCHSDSQWNGTTNGAASFVPFRNGGGGQGWYAAQMSVSSSSLTVSSVIMGFEVGVNERSPTCGYTNVTVAYSEAYNSSGVLIGRNCIEVPSYDYNTEFIWNISEYVSNGGGMQAYMRACDTCFVLMDGNFAYSAGAVNTFSVIQIKTAMQWVSWNGNAIPSTITYLSNQWFTNDTPTYQSRVPDSTVVANPPQWVWNPYPASGNHGGAAWSCGKPSGSSCP